MRKYFGTDGVRGTVGTFPILPDWVLKLGWAAGIVLAGTTIGRKKVLIGKDTRISGYMFESALEAGLAAAGVDTHLLGPMPTPAVAYLTRTLHAQAGIVISASHNPYRDNGIKFFSETGFKLPDEVEAAIEAQMEEPLTLVNSKALGKATRVKDAQGRYIEFCKGVFPFDLDLKGVRLGLDCAHGATYQVAPCVFEELGAEVFALGVQPDGLNINHESGTLYPKRLVALVKEKQLDLGIALDGDGDRLIMVDHRGHVLDGDELLYILAKGEHESPYRRDNGNQGAGEKNMGIVGTLMSNLGLETGLKELGIAFQRVAVGDRYILDRLLKNGWKMGGEPSGHLICLDSNTTGDGIIAALRVLTLLQRTGKSLCELKQGMSKYPQTLINVQISELPGIVMGHAQVKAAAREAEAQLKGRGRVLLRPSGTERMIRVMVEGENAGEVDKIAQSLAEVVKAVVR